MSTQSRGKGGKQAGPGAEALGSRNGNTLCIFLTQISYQQNKLKWEKACLACWSH